MADSIVKYTANGTIREFSIPFDYISRDDVVVLVAGSEATFTFLNDTTVSLAVIPALNTVVVIKRQTSKVPLVDFTDGSTLFEADLDLANQQARYLAEEARDRAENSMELNDADGTWNAKGFRIRNIGEPLTDDEVATKGFVNTSGSSIIAEAIAIRNELYNLSPVVERLPYGSVGYSQYEANTGTFTLFLSEGPQGVQGIEGQVGPNGPQGPVGIEGPRGPEGPRGQTGDTGAEGPTGIQGVTGLQGIKGDQGDRGLEGVQGNLGETGPTGPQGIEGDVGPIGPQGIQGQIGDQGPTGATGPQGDTGLDGVQGNIGETGPTGPQGLTGDTGAQGPEGPTGPQGVEGDTGLQGPLGPVGPVGPQGPEGVEGPRGLQGVTGEQGLLGPQGVLGPIGPQGIQGIQGDVGPDGSQGPDGNMGATPLGLAFGRFFIDDDGVLQIEYYGSADTNDFTIDADGYLFVETV